MEALKPHNTAGTPLVLGVRRGHVCFWPALLVFITVGYFQVENPGVNVNRQFALTCLWSQPSLLSLEDLLLEPGLATPPADRYRGLVLTDTQPVVALLGMPTFRVYRFLKAKGPQLFSYSQARYSTRWLTIGLASALLTALVTLWLLRHGVSPLRSALASTLVISATPLMGFSLSYSNDLPACALAFWGYYLLRASRRGHRGYLRLLAAGFLTGLAVWALPALSPPALLLSLWLIADPSMAFRPGGREIRTSGRRLTRILCWLTALGAGVSGWFVFTPMITGLGWPDPFVQLGDPNLRQALEGSFFGLGRPRWLYMMSQLFGRGFGLLVNFSWVLVMLAGLAVILRRRRSALWPDALFATAVFLSMLILSSAHVTAWEGFGYAPRHLVGALAFVWIGLTPWLVARLRLIVAGVLALGCMGAVVNLVYLAGFFSLPGAVTGDLLGNLPGLPVGIDGPLFHVLGQADRTGVIRNNWGTELGLHGLSSLAPLALSWGAFWGWFIFGMRKPSYPRSRELVTHAMIDIGPPPPPRNPVLYQEPPDIHEHPHEENNHKGD